MSSKKSKKIRQRKPDLQPPTAPPRFQWVTSCAGPGILILVFVALAWWSWRKWPDIQIDFGQQLYIPWQLTSGKLLHKDLIILHGPFSQLFNALWFKLLGPSLTVIIFLNLAILAGIAAMIYWSVHRFADSFTATVAGVALLTLFGFSQYVGVGNYNYITPYTHEATHGMALTSAMIVALVHHFTRGGRLSLLLSGLCLGLALLTKIEVALAALLVALTGLITAFLFAPPGRSPKKGDLAYFCAAAILPCFGFLLFFLTYLDLDQALKAVAQGFLVLSNEVVGSDFYLRILGLDNPGENLSLMLVMFLAIAMFVIAAAAIDLAMHRIAPSPHPIGVVLALLLGVGLYFNPEVIPWINILRALPLTTGLTLVVLLIALNKHRREVESWSRIFPALLWTTFAVGLLAKMALNVHIYHYGFYLPMPATLVLVVGLVHGVPKLLAGRAANGVVFRSLVLALLTIAILYHLTWSQKFYRVKDFAVGKGADRILTYGPKVRSAGLVTALTLEWLEGQTAPGATLVGLPEGIMINYLSRRATTVPYVNFMVPELIVFGETRMLNAIKSRPPGYVMLVDNNPSEFGVGPFGSDPRNGKQIMDWVNRQYKTAALFGSEPLQGGRFGIKVLEYDRGRQNQ